MLPLRNDGAGLTVRMKLNLPVGFPYCCGALLMFFATLQLELCIRSRAVQLCMQVCSCVTLLTALTTALAGGSESYSDVTETVTGLSHAIGALYGLTGERLLYL